VKFARENTNGLPVHFHEEDYRNASGKFDRVISVGLMEHIGPKNYRDSQSCRIAGLN
ncbi:MAG: Cyclopropane-fatty-acyl-phospholipid synthase, partial [Candidatus Wolfebacteria bacterium GW2011_GWA1_47_6]